MHLAELLLNEEQVKEILQRRYPVPSAPLPMVAAAPAVAVTEPISPVEKREKADTSPVVTAVPVRVAPSADASKVAELEAKLAQLMKKMEEERQREKEERQKEKEEAERVRQRLAKLEKTMQQDGTVDVGGGGDGNQKQKQLRLESTLFGHRGGAEEGTKVGLQREVVEHGERLNTLSEAVAQLKEHAGLANPEISSQDTTKSTTARKAKHDVLLVPPRIPTPPVL